MAKKTWAVVAIALVLLLWIALAGVAPSRGGLRLFACCPLPPLGQSAER